MTSLPLSIAVFLFAIASTAMWVWSIYLAYLQPARARISARASWLGLILSSAAAGVWLRQIGALLGLWPQ